VLDIATPRRLMTLEAAEALTLKARTAVAALRQ
jgi:hypothetical protein